jgi:hypothetical protein
MKHLPLRPPAPHERSDERSAPKENYCATRYPLPATRYPLHCYPLPALLATLFCLAFALFPTRAFGLSPGCQEMEDLEALSSHYTQRVLDRADAGIVYAQSAGVASPFIYLVPWAEQVASSWLSLIDTQQRVTFQQRSLLESSTCRRFDMKLIECKMDEVRDVMNQSLEKGSYKAIIRLQSLLAFLDERAGHLERGSMDPTYIDAGWGKRQLFDPPEPVWCCPAEPWDVGEAEGDEGGDGEGEDEPNLCVQTPASTCIDEMDGLAYGSLDLCMGAGCEAPLDLEAQPEEEGSMCPFHSDYLDPMVSGFGCDEQVLELLAADPAVAQELTVLRAITGQLNDFRSEAEELLETQRALEELLELEQSPLLPPPREHKTAYGCFDRSGVCADDPEQSCRRDADCEAGPGSCIFPRGTCSDNRLATCFEDDDCAEREAGYCIVGPAEPIPAFTLRGPFTVDKNHLGILSRFTRQRMQQGRQREFADDLKTAGEFPADKPNEIASRRGADFLEQMLRSAARYTFALWSKLQGQAESEIFPAASDSQMTVTKEMAPLREQVRGLSFHASSSQGVRRFVVGLAYWLRRTCMERPCNLRLQQILKIAFEDACFPYADGAFLSDSEEEPRWKVCAEAACIGMPGAELDEDRCEGIP